MKLTVKNVKINKAMSDETTCFSCDVYIDGKMKGTAMNRGCGGANEYRPRELREVMSDNLDEQICIAIDLWVFEQKLRRSIKTKTVFRLKTDPKDSWRTVLAVYSPDVKQFIMKKYGDAVEEILNERRDW